MTIKTFNLENSSIFLIKKIKLLIIAIFLLFHIWNLNNSDLFNCFKYFLNFKHCLKFVMNKIYQGFKSVLHRNNLFIILLFSLLTSCSNKKNTVITPYKNTLQTIKTTHVGQYKPGRIYEVRSTKYQTVQDVKSYKETGLASWYGPGWHGKLTASGETFDKKKLTCAHRHLPMNSVLKITNTENGKSIIVRVADRGPYSKNNGFSRVVDVSEGAAEILEFKKRGLAKVKIEYLDQETKLFKQLKGNSSTSIRKLNRKQKNERQIAFNKIIQKFNANKKIQVSMNS